jgi:glutathionylspermidine synthase
VGVEGLEVKKVSPLTLEFLESIGFSWHTNEDDSGYISDRVVRVSEIEARAYYEASNELYNMFVEAGEYVIENDLLHKLGVPFNLQKIVKLSWESDVHWHLYGRFDLAGGLDGKPIKLLEFNADTPTSLLDSAVAQWALLKKNNFNEDSQFNNIHQSILENFQRLVTLEDSIDKFSEYYDGWKILFTSLKGAYEDENTVRYLMSIALEAGFECEFAYIDEIEFDQSGIYYKDIQYEYLFKLIPWEDIALEEPDLVIILTEIIENQKAIILNPAYTVMFQNKAILNILWELFPNHPLLLESSFEPLVNKAYVKKPIFGREGRNITIVDQDGEIKASSDGEYGEFDHIYQEFATLNKDSSGVNYQAGLFFAYEGCGLGFRSDKNLIIDDNSQFVGHFIPS